MVAKEARFRVEVTQRRLAQWAKIGKESQGDLADHIHRVTEILVKALPESAILLSTGLMVTRGVVIPMPIPINHPSWQNQAESGNKSVKMPTDFTEDLIMKMPASTSKAEKQTVGK